jgi:predicted nucleic acid-binding protein
VIVVDTSAVIDLLRGRRTMQARNLELLIELGETIALPAVVMQELLQGARDESEWRALSRYLATQEILGADRETHRRAAKIYYDCRRGGLTVRSSVDCLIAQIALDHGGFLLADDRDYAAIAAVRPLQIVRTVTLDEETDDE